MVHLFLDPDIKNIQRRHEFLRRFLTSPISKLHYSPPKVQHKRLAEISSYENL
jgi:hypothetical protein